MPDAEDPPEVPSGSPLPPMLDRPWLHPSELPPAPRRSRIRRVIRAGVVPLVCAAAGAGATVAILAVNGVFDDPARDTARALAAQTDTEAGRSPENASPAVVAVIVTTKTARRHGAGVCIDAAGRILTSAALTNGARYVEIVDSAGITRGARFIGRDAVSGLALLQTRDALPVAPIASNSAQLGDPVFAIGAYPTGTRWLNDGIVASVDAWVSEGSGLAGSGLLEASTDATNEATGGALVDLDGRVVGILIAPIRGRPGALAIPIGRAASVGEKLDRYGWVDHGSIGVAHRDVADMAAGPTLGAVVGPAKAAGLRPGDVVVRVDGHSIFDAAGFFAAMSNAWPGESVEVTVRRGKHQQHMKVRLDSARKDTAGKAAAAP